MTKISSLDIIGWREWLSLPQLGIQAIKAKVDTGARTSALHAFQMERLRKKGRDLISFQLHPLQRNQKKVVQCESEIKDFRWVTDSGGHQEQRFVIETQAQLGHLKWPIELTLTNRDTMAFRMLLGRQAIKGQFMVNPNRSYLIGAKPK